MRRLATAALTLCVLLTGCDGFGLDPPTIVRTPRILAIVADPPESAPGTDIHLSAMTFDPEGRALTHRWRACLSPFRLARASGLPVEVPASDRCTPLDGSPDAMLSGEATTEVIETLEDLAALGGFPAEGLAAIVDTAGLAFIVELDVLSPEGEVLVSGYKRVALTRRPMPTTNPPPISFMVGETLVEPDVTLPFTCVPASGTPMRVAAGERIELVPVFPEDGETWLESFLVFDYSGGITPGTENAYYSFYATGGGISEGTTRPPNRESEWGVPQEPGEHSLFFVTRDGHLGTTACRLDVVVE